MMFRSPGKSTPAAELYALDCATDYVLYLFPFLRQLFQSRFSLAIASDAADVLAQLRRDHPNPRERALTHVLAELKSKYTVISAFSLEHDLSVNSIPLHVPSAQNVADLLTKPLPTHALLSRMFRG